MNTTLSRIVAWGNKWQVKLAPHKTQLLHVSRSSAALRLICDGKTLVPQDEVEVLGVTYDCRLTFKAHIERLARESSGKLASLRRMSWILDSKGLEVLYKAQDRSSMEYACLGWGGAANKHLALLDKVQGRAVRLIRDSGAGQ
ncbi:putative RNA-directed DNA polymerase from transposon BS [Chionoecetes opilio]|uniref:Putative RNA-directed DNA polymerase from transposon BS n=1 Tax=Chionoecetes opilio TaxID=41210 RepID=A0A8J4YTN2_CHIOP|nr:putative RNA-directed DNA polymerase from transposon BS [Chionoecetes opilio]